MAEVSFLLDEHIDRAVAVRLRQAGIDTVTAAEAGLRQRSDDDHITFGLATGRVIVTLDRGFLLRHYANEQHAGIVYCRAATKTIGEFIEFLELVHDTYTAEEMVGRLERM